MSPSTLQTTIGADTVKVKYDPMGNRLWRETFDGSTTTTRKYIVDISGGLPVILCEINPTNSSLKKSYIYSDSGQILAQRDGGQSANEYFYVTDRLGSVRQVINSSGDVLRNYTYDPFGQTLEESGSFANNFMFTGQWYDSEISQYHLRARMYDPNLMRFTSRDPVFGKSKNPMSLHPYLYCRNDSINRIDPSGKWAVVISGELSGNYTDIISDTTKSYGIVGGAMARNAVLSLLCAEVGGGFGGNIGAGAFFGKGDKGWFGGTIQYSAGGVSIATGSGAALTLSIGFSPNAQKAQDLAGGFTEYGGSITGPAPVGSTFFSGTGGFSYAVGDTGTTLYTVSGGPAYSTWGWGAEGHVYRGYATVQEW